VGAGVASDRSPRPHHARWCTRNPCRSCPWLRPRPDGVHRSPWHPAPLRSQPWAAPTLFSEHTLALQSRPGTATRESGMGMASEFKAFIMRGNVVDLAVGVVIGAAFGKITSALV